MKLIYKLSLGVVVAAVLVVFLGYALLGQLKKMAQPLYNDIPQSIEMLDKALYLDHLAGNIIYYDEVLTQAARNYAFTGDYKWKQRYLDVEPELDRIIKFALERSSDTDKDNFKKVDTANIALLDMEHRAIDLVDEGEREEAIKILEGENYTQEKNNYKTAIQSYREIKGVEYENSLKSAKAVTFGAIENTQLIVLRSINLTIISILLVFVAVFSLSTFFSHSITNALDKLRVLTLEISRGNFSFRTNIKAKDEFGQLANSFNNMAQVLESKTTSIELLNKEIEERKILTDKLKEAKEEWERTFDSIGDFVFIQDRNKNIIRCNQSFSDAMGLKMEEIIGKKCFEIVHKSDKPWPLCPFEETLKDKKTHIQEVDDPKVGIPLLVTTSPMLDNEGNLLGIVHIAKDISKIKEVDKIKDDFISTVSHELRTPLSIAKEGISLVLDGIVGDVTEEQRDILTTSKNNIDRLARIINNLLDISKIEFGKVQLQKVNIDLIEQIKNVLSSFDLKIKAAGLAINTVFNSAKININVDSDKIIQAMTNLVNNAIKFTEKGSIEVSVLDKGDYVECSVSDTGIGIQEKDLPNVFSKFQQFRRTPGPGDKGTGLGLSISKGIIEAHSGHIWVTSKPEEGTKFTFTLPKA